LGKYDVFGLSKKLTENILEQIEECKNWYNNSYKKLGFNAQRLYPNEEFLRFMGRHFFSKIPKEERANIKLLEVGCRSCSNLWMTSKEGLNSYGIDLSEESLILGKKCWIIGA